MIRCFVQICVIHNESYLKMHWTSWTEGSTKMQCKKTVADNQKETYNLFTFSTKASQNSLYYAEWTFRTIRYCSDRELPANFPLCLK